MTAQKAPTAPLDLTVRQHDLLREVLSQYGAGLLWTLDEGARLSRSDVVAVIEVLSGEFASSGLREDHEPNARGLDLERLIDAVNRCGFM